VRGLVTSLTRYWPRSGCSVTCGSASTASRSCSDSFLHCRRSLSVSASLPVPALLLILAALTTGVAAAYGRELQAGRNPKLRWWASRLLLFPTLVIGSAAIRDLFALPPSMTMLTAAMLALGGYDGLRWLENHWRAQVTGINGSDEPRRRNS
jgi:hypothetical protein